jgi:ankyrin repeat protein
MKRRNTKKSKANKRQRIGKEEKTLTPIQQLLQAIKKNNFDKVCNLLQSSVVDPNEKNDNGETALILATQKGNLQIAKELLKHGANVNAKNDRGINPHSLLVASKNGNEEFVTLLLKNNANPNVQNKKGKTSLLIISETGVSCPIAESLLKHGADPSIKDKKGNTAMVSAFSKNHFSLCELFIKNGVNLPNQGGDTNLITADKAKSLKLVHFLLKQGNNVNEKDSEGYTAFSYACRGMAFFDWEYKKAAGDIIMTLLKNRADPNIKVKNDLSTAIMIATCEQNIFAVKTLLKYDANPNQKCSQSPPPFWASDLNWYYPTYGDSRSAIMKATETGNLEIFEILMNHGADLEAKDGNGQNPFILAARYESFEIMDALIERGVDLKAMDHEGRNALCIAMEKGYEEVANKLFDQGVELHVPSSCTNGETKLILAARSTSSKIVTTLIQKGADVDGKDANGRTALMHASEIGALEVVKTLMEFEANIFTKDNEEKSAINFSSEGKHDNITLLFLEYGAGENLDKYLLAPSKVRQHKEKIYRRIKRIESVLFPDDTPVIAQIIAEFTFGVHHLQNYLDKHPSYKK